MKSYVRAMRSSAGPFLVSLLLGACGAQAGENALDGDVEFGERTEVCCDAECVSGVGYYLFKSEGETTYIRGRASITELGSGVELVEDAQTNGPNLGLEIANTALAPFEGQTIEVLVEVDAIGYESFSQTYSVRIQRSVVCCSSCLTTNQQFEIELGPSRDTLVDGCHESTGAPDCPSRIPGTYDECSAPMCCNYGAGEGQSLGCSCEQEGDWWTCSESACSCS